jgi:hypothetical protein
MIPEEDYIRGSYLATDTVISPSESRIQSNEKPHMVGTTRHTISGTQSPQHPRKRYGLSHMAQAANPGNGTL